MSVNHIGLSLEEIRHYLEGSNINVFVFLDNTKASEFYIRTQFIQDDDFSWTTIVPYIYRRTGLELKNEKDIADYLRSVKKYFTKDWMDSWVKKEKKECLADIEAKKKQMQTKKHVGKKRVR